MLASTLHALTHRPPLFPSLCSAGRVLSHLPGHPQSGRLGAGPRPAGPRLVSPTVCGAPPAAAHPRRCALLRARPHVLSQQQRLSLPLLPPCSADDREGRRHGRQAEAAGGPAQLALAFLGKLAVLLVGVSVLKLGPPPLLADFLYCEWERHIMRLTVLALRTGRAPSATCPAGPPTPNPSPPPFLPLPHAALGLYSILSFVMDGPGALLSWLTGAAGSRSLLLDVCPSTALAAPPPPSPTTLCLLPSARTRRHRD